MNNPVVQSTVLLYEDRFAGKSDIMSGVDVAHSFIAPDKDSHLSGIFEHISTLYDFSHIKLEKDKTGNKSYAIKFKQSLTSLKVLDYMRDKRVYAALFEEFLQFCKINTKEIQAFSREEPLVCLIQVSSLLKPSAIKATPQSLVLLTYNLEGEQYLDYAPNEGMWHKGVSFLVTKTKVG